MTEVSQLLAKNKDGDRHELVQGVGGSPNIQNKCVGRGRGEKNEYVTEVFQLLARYLLV